MKEKISEQSLPNTASPAWVAASFMSELIAKSTPEDFGRHLTEQIRELTGARTVLLLSQEGVLASCNVLYIYPQRRAGLFSLAELSLFCPGKTSEELPIEVVDMPSDHSLTSLLQNKSIHSMLRVPLLSGGKNNGMLLLFDLPEPKRMNDVLDTLAFLGPFFGVALDNLYAREKIHQQNELLEQAVADQTVELQDANRYLKQARVAALNLMEDAIKDKEQLEVTQYALDNSADSVFWMEPDGRFSYVNNSACALLEYSNEELLQLSVGDIDPDFSRKRYVSLLHRLQRAGSFIRELRLVAKTGKIIPVSIQVSLIRYAGREFACIFAHDITERNQFMDALQASEEHLRTTLSSIGDAVITTDADGQVESMNPVAEQLTGWSARKAVGQPLRNVLSIINEQTRAPMESPLQKVLETGKIVELANHALLITKDGQEIPIADSGAPIKNDTGRITGAVLVFRDQTKNRAARNALEASEERLQRAQKVAQVGHWEFDFSTGIFSTSIVAQRIYGLENSTNDRDYIRKIPLPEYRAMLDEAMLALREQDIPYDVEFRIQRPEDGTIRDIHSVAVYNPDQNVVFGVIQDITERKTSERAREHSEAEYHRLFENMPTGFSLNEMIYDDQGVAVDYRFIQINPAFEKITGLTAGQTIGHTVKECLPDLESSWIETYAEVAETGRAINFVNHSSDLNKHFDVRAFSSTPGQFAVVFSDITDRIQAAQLVQRSEAKYRLLFEQSGDAYLIIREGRYIDCNQAAVDMLHYESKQQLLNTEPADLSPEIQPDGQSSRKKADDIIQSMEKNESRRFEWVHTRANGEDFPVEVSLTAILDNDDNPIIHTVWRDITESKAATAELLATRKQLQYIIDHTHDVILQIDLTGRYIYVNSSGETMTGYTVDELLSMNMVRLVAPEYHELVSDRLEKRKNGNLEEGSFAFEIIRKNGERIWVELNTSPILNDAGELEGVQAVARDITEHKRMLETIENRIVALTRPLDATEEIDFDILFNLDEIQRIQDEFAAATGVASVITNPDGVPLTRPSNFTRFCNDIIRDTEQGCADCFHSDSILGRFHPEGPVVQPCLSGGLWDAGASISVGGKHIASWLIGQVRDETQTEEDMRANARRIGANEEEYITAFREVPVVSLEHFREISQALFTLANQLSTTAYQNVQQARFITEQKKTEEKLNLTQFTVDQSPDAAYWIDLSGRFIYVNDTACQTLGYSKEELYSMYLWDVDSSCLAENWPTVIKENQVQGSVLFESMHRNKDGSSMPVEIVSSYVEFGENQFLCRFAHDITKRKSGEKERRLLATAIDQSPETVVITDATGAIQYANPAFEQISGYSRENALGKTPGFLKSGLHDHNFYSNLWKTLASGKIWEGRFVNRHKNGMLYNEEASIAPVKDETGNITNYVAVKRDITDELVQEEALRQAHKMDAVGQLAGGIAHDFNNILQGIQGFSEILEYSLKPGSQNHANSIEIKKAAKRAAELTQQLLTFSRKQPTSFEELDLNDIVNDTLALLDMLLGEKYDIEVEQNPNLPSLMSDRGQLTQVIMNLAVNARDAMPEGGRLSLVTECEELSAEDALRIPDVKPGRYVVLSITDTGCGIPDDVRERLFEPFFTTKEVGSGTGLGLSVVYGIVKQNQGTICVYSEIGKGTCFRVYFGAKQLEGSEPLSIGNSICTPARILVVEDHPDVSHMMVETLSEVGYEVQIAKSAEEGFEIFESSARPYDLLISDMELPGMGGNELAEKISISHPELPVLLYSGYRDHKQRWSQIDRQGYAFINKPFTSVKLLNMIAALLRS